mgnify:CR=1 FL=1
MSETVAVRQVDVGDALTDMWRSVLLFVPRAIAFIAILVIGWIIARFVLKVVDRVLERVGFDRAVERGGVGRALERTKYDASDILAKLAFYAVMLFTLQFAFGVWGPNAISDLIGAVVAWLPRAFVAIVIVVVATAIANAVRDLVSGALGGLSYGRALATLAAVVLPALLVLVTALRATVLQARPSTTAEPSSAPGHHSVGAALARLREEMQVELIELHRRLGLTTIFVTHDQEEALSLSDRIILINAGRIEQEGAPGEIYARPATAFASGFLGSANVVAATIEEIDGAPVAVLSDGQRLALAAGEALGILHLPGEGEHVVPHQPDHRRARFTVAHVHPRRAVSHDHVASAYQD